MRQVVIARDHKRGKEIRHHLNAAGIPIRYIDVYSGRSPHALEGLRFDIAYVDLGVKRLPWGEQSLGVLQRCMAKTLTPSQIVWLDR